MRLLNYATPERRVDLFGIQGRVMSSLLIRTFASVVKLGTGEKSWEYSRNMPTTQGTSMPTLHTTAFGSRHDC